MVPRHTHPRRDLVSMVHAGVELLATWRIESTKRAMIIYGGSRPIEKTFG